MADDSPLIRRLKALIAAANAKKAGRLRMELRKIVAALDGLLGCTGPNARPGLADAVQGEEDGIDDVVRFTWAAAHKVIRAIGDSPVAFPYRLSLTGATGLRYKAAAGQLHTAMWRVRERWGYPTEFWDQGMAFDFGKYRTSHAIPPPIIEPAEYALLSWCRGELVEVIKWLEAIEKPKPVSSVSGGMKDRVRPITAQAQTGGDDPVWGPWIACSKTKLAKALADISKSNASKVIQRMVDEGGLRMQKGKNPLNGYQRWKVQIKDPVIREKVQKELIGR